MGNKETKSMNVQGIVEAAAQFGGRSRGEVREKEMSKEAEDLAECLASLSDMANTGMDISEVLLPGQPFTQSDLTPRTVRRMSVKLKQKLQSQMHSVSQDSVSINTEDIEDMLQNLDIKDEKGDSKEWVQMRSWLVWCIQNNLHESEDDLDGMELTNKRRRMSRQASFDHPARLHQRRLSHQAAFDVNRDGKMSAQSSLESNAET